MRKNNCEVIRQELDELMLGQARSASVVEHLRDCSACREFHEKQTKLRQIVGSLGTVAAPADFDFRLRARLAGNSSSAAFHLNSYWPFARRGFAVAAVLIVFAVGAVLMRNVLNQPAAVTQVAKERPHVVQPPKPAEIVTPQQGPEQSQPQQQLVAVTPDKTKSERPTQSGSRNKRSVVAVDFSSERAEVINGSQPAGISAAFPIDASLQSFRVSLDDGRGNARTISVPTISFGSQRMLQTGNQFAPKGIW
jgi:hypothetical protein